MGEMAVEAHIGPLEVGAGIEVMTAKEVIAAIKATNQEEYDKYSKLKRPYRQAASKILDANGNGEWEVGDTIPTGKRVEISRVIFWADGFTPIAPYTNAALWLAIFRNHGQMPTEMWDYFPYSGTAQLPATAEYSSTNILHFEANNKIVPVIKGGPANGNVTVTVSGYIYELC